MQFYGDYHTHSIYSDGQATIAEMVEAARKRGLREIAVTDHGPRNIGTGVKGEEVYLDIKSEVKKLQAEYNDINIQAGCEADVVSARGEIDVSPKIYRELDLLIIGLHPYVLPANWEDGVNIFFANQLGKLSRGIKEKTTNVNTKALIEAVYRHGPDIISHPGLQMAVDYDEVARACVKQGVAFEINAGHRHPSLEEIKPLVGLDLDFIINSDAHFPESVGMLGYGWEVLQQAGVPREKIVNLEGPFPGRKSRDFSELN